MARYRWQIVFAMQDTSVSEMCALLVKNVRTNLVQTTATSATVVLQHHFHLPPAHQLPHVNANQDIQGRTEVPAQPAHLANTRLYWAAVHVMTVHPFLLLSRQANLQRWSMQMQRRLRP